MVSRRAGSLFAAPPPLQRLLCLLLVALLLAAPSSALHDHRELRQGATPEAAPPVFCADVGVEISFPSGDVQAAMADLHDDDDVAAEAAVTGGYTPESCLRSSLMLAVADHMKSALRNFAVSALDCVPAPLDAESSTIALFAIASVCSRSNVALGTDMAAWTADVKSELDKLFALSSGHQQRITFARTTGLLRQVALSQPYVLPDDGNGVPVLDLQAVSMWSEGEDGEDATGNDDESSVFTLVKLDVENKGAIPLHLFRVTIARQKAAAINMDDTLDASSEAEAFVVPLIKPVAVDPGASSTITFKTVTTSRITTNSLYAMYISHTGFRAHIFDGALRERREFAFQKPAINTGALRVEGDNDANVFARYSVPSGLLDSKLSAFPLATWQVGSMGIAVAVGLFATMFFLRRKFRGLYYMLCGCCLWVSRGRTAAKRTKSLRSKATSTSSTSRSSSTNSEDDDDRAIEMKRLSSDSTAKATAKVDDAPIQPNRQRLQVKAPEISLARKAQASAGSRPPLYSSPQARAKATAKMASGRPSPRLGRQQQAPVASAPSKPLDLDGSARLEPQRFESMWDEYAQRFQGTMPQAASPKESVLMANMERAGISCMASGTVNGVEKYVFYAKECVSPWFFLVAVDVMAAAKSVTVTVRTSRDAGDESVQQLVELVTNSIANSSA